MRARQRQSPPQRLKPRSWRSGHQFLQKLLTTGTQRIGPPQDLFTIDNDDDAVFLPHRNRRRGAFADIRVACSVFKRRRLRSMPLSSSRRFCGISSFACSGATLVDRNKTGCSGDSEDYRTNHEAAKTKATGTRLNSRSSCGALAGWGCTCYSLCVFCFCSFRLPFVAIVLRCDCKR
jgi:hypothetical protein